MCHYRSNIDIPGIQLSRERGDSWWLNCGAASIWKGGGGATENMTSGNKVLKSMYSPLRIRCCIATGTGGRDCNNTGSEVSV